MFRKCVPARNSSIAWLVAGASVRSHLLPPPMPDAPDPRTVPIPRFLDTWQIHQATGTAHNKKNDGPKATIGGYVVRVTGDRAKTKCRKRGVKTIYTPTFAAAVRATRVFLCGDE